MICFLFQLSRCPRAGQANTFGIAPKVFKNASQNNPSAAQGQTLTRYFG
jgi:hypothetical protein